MQAVGKILNSLQSIVNTIDIDLFVGNETHLKKPDKFKLEGYTCFTKNRQNTPMGGIATAIANEYAANALKISEGKSEEYIVTRHGNSY